MLASSSSIAIEYALKPYGAKTPTKVFPKSCLCCENREGKKTGYFFWSGESGNFNTQLVQRGLKKIELQPQVGREME
jgi:hypothetical protein